MISELLLSQGSGKPGKPGKTWKKALFWKILGKTWKTREKGRKNGLSHGKLRAI